MADVDGSWQVVIKSPLGDQVGTLTVRSAGDTFTGQMTGAMGAAAVANGTVDGNALAWKMAVTVPMPLSLDCTATVDGDAMTGQVGAGAFGSFPMTGTRG